MREIPEHIWEIWNAGGPAVGREGAPHGRVTVEIDWQLTAETDPGSYDRGAIRWWQRADNSQVETEIPNIERISIDRSLDQDAASCDITLSNQWHHANGTMAVNDINLGVPGYFTFGHGDSTDAETLWDQVPNAWNDVIIPDALLRTYQGYGGKDKTVVQALADGNIVLTGVWLIDEVQVGTNGKVQIKCRDMAKLLIEQQIYPPLAPADLYPLKFCRWGFSDLGSDETLMEVDAANGILQPNPTPVLVRGLTDYAGDVPEPNYPDYEGNEPGNGYWLLSDDGELWGLGNNSDLGDATSISDWAGGNVAAGIAGTITGAGYWIVARNGDVVAHGDAVHMGDAAASFAVAIERTYHGDGYWILERDGSIHTFGAATNHGEPDTDSVFPQWWLSEAAVDMAADPIDDGYWTVTNEGTVEAFGSAVHYGDPYPSSIRTFVRIIAHPLGEGYWVMDQIGNVHAYGRAEHFGQLAGQAYVALGGNLPFDNPEFPDYMSDLIPTPSGNGYWLTGTSGGVYSFGDAKLLGGLNGPYEAWLRTEGNYMDYTDVVEELLLWAGFWLYESLGGGDPPVVYGNLETTGAYASDCLPDDMLDKAPVIDPITRIKEIVGYIFFVDDEGAVHFESPNIYTEGNFNESGERIDTVPVIDEALQMTNYGVVYNDRSSRSEIIISTTDPTEALDDTITTRYTPVTSEILRGISKPAMWVNGVFTSQREQQIMAELIGLYSWLAQRQGSTTCMANPAIQINDQVRIFERTTSETYVHYVRGVTSDMDLITGSYTMTLTTHWMGDDTVWAVDIGRVPFEFETEMDAVTITYRRSSIDVSGDETVTALTDNNLATSWLVVGNTGQLISEAVEYIEFDCADSAIDTVCVYPFGAQTVWVSVMEGGVWQSDGGSSIAYSPIDPPGLTGDQSPDIAWVASESVDDEEPVVITLPQTYTAQRVRITLSGFEESDWGPQYYYGGLREVSAGLA